MKIEEIGTLEIKLNNAKRINEQIGEIKLGIKNIKYLMEYSGNKILTGKTGRIGEDNFMFQIGLNAFGCAKAVPELMIQKGNEKIKQLERELELI